jgi:hypothetical protein
MAMQKKLWSISALATELGLDRRTLSKRLEGLPPIEENRVGGRIEKRWHLADVLEHFKKPRARPAIDPVEKMKEIVGQKMYPSLVSSRTFRNILMHGIHEEMGLTKVQAMRCYQFASAALLWAFSEIHEDEEMKFAIPDNIKEMHDLGLDDYVTKHWPN